MVDAAGAEMHVLLSTDDLQLVHNYLEPGGESEPHAHDEAQMGYVIAGEGEQIVDGEVYPLEAGMAYALEPGEEHAMRATGSERMEVVHVFHPPRPVYE